MANKNIKNKQEPSTEIETTSSMPTSDGGPSVEMRKAIENIKQAASQEPLILKSKINTAARTAFQALKILYAKKLAGMENEEKANLEGFYQLTEAHGFKKRTVQRRIQTAKAMVDSNLVGTELQAKIEGAQVLGDELLAEIEGVIQAKVGSISYTALMRWLGVLEKSEEERVGGEPEVEETGDQRISKKLESAYNFIDKVYELRREMRKEGIFIGSDLLEVFEALDHALVALGSYLSPNRVAYEKARIEATKEGMNTDHDPDEAVESELK